MTTLRIISRSSPPQYGLVALATYINSLSTQEVIKTEFVYSIDDGALSELSLAGQKVVGQEEIMKALGTEFNALGLNGSSPAETEEINAFTATFPSFPPVFGPSSAFVDALDTRLTLRTFLFSHQPTVADFATWGLFRINTVIASSAKKPQHVHSTRWFNYFESLPSITESVSNILIASKMKAPPLPKGEVAKANATFELGLPNAIKGGVVTRFPPEPSGYLHIGHAKAAILNQYFAKLYEGKFLIRFDDTNPSKEKAEFEDSIVEDLALLGVKGDYVTHTSDYFDQLYTLCVQMIEEDNAYADDTAQEKMRDERMNGIASTRRACIPAESLARFKEMESGSEEGKKWCIRAKISADNPNKAMRDPVIYRGNALPHHRTGDKYKIYPTYDFACPIVDCLEGVTHALRTNEYRDRNPQYQWMLDALKMRKVEVWDFGRVNFVHTLLSKRKLKWFVDEGHVRGWDDARFPTVRGIRRRGLTIEALTQYMLLQGPSQAQTNLEWDSIWNTNKKVIDPIAPRYVALEAKNLVKVSLRGEGTPTTREVRKLPKHKKDIAIGEKDAIYADEIYLEQEDAASFELGEEITLMDWGNAFVRKIVGSPVESIELELNLTGDYKKTKKKVTWLSSPSTSPSDLTPVCLLDYDYLITKKKLEEDDSVEDFLTPVTEFAIDGVADINVKTLKKGDIIQFERKGYYIIDKAAGVDSESLPGPLGTARVEAIFIPDGRAASIALKHVAPVVTKVTKSKPVTTAKIPTPAPTESVTTILLSEGKKGFEIPVLTKMYCVENVYGNDGVEAKAKTEMFDVTPMY